jgi:hypothetical protein
VGTVAKHERMAPDLHAALAGVGFRKRRRMVLLLLTTDPQGFPRVALLTMGEVRANSASELAIAVRAGSRTAFNLVRRGTATLLYMNRRVTASVQARAGRGRVSGADPARRLFPLKVERVRVDRPEAEEGDVALLTGPTFGGADSPGLFSPELFDELGKVRPA